ncbi:Tim17/Tim22/Tim23/Pmp24 family-domain-containing protein [Entophlyctis helioformis]|nr:Tim17/Tim22/Tim23/Pmp24 family-domain-containing protein [Entophlyctis helioformis]
MAQQPQGQFPSGLMSEEDFENMRAAQERRRQEDIFKSAMESCPGKLVASGVIGFGLGTAFGLFMSSVDWNINTEEFQKLTTRQQIKHTFKDMASKSYGTAKNFALVGAIFSSSECVVESFRAKHDIYNPLISGCFAGSVLSAKAGPKAMLFGCAGFAAFSAAIETWTSSMD